MQNYRNYVSPMVEKFFSGKYNGMSGPPKYNYISENGPHPQSPCRSANGYPPLDDEAYEYCSDTQTIYLAQEKMWKYYHFGNIAPAVGLAHEWGHHIQFMAKVKDPKNDSEYLTHELQADCVAGAWIQYADQQGWFEGRGGGSIKGVADGFSKNPDNYPSHGTAGQREKAMLKGFNSGLRACNEYYPEHHIISG
ncbi:MAG: neutral zinc metallopeptidase [Pseudonocardiaceae bacterium]